VVAQFERSGERQAEFCARRSIGLSALQHWLYRLRREARKAGKPGKPAERFVPVVVSRAAPTDTTVCRLRMAGAELSFSELPPASYVTELLRLMDR
jgi:hypothetical protein